MANKESYRDRYRAFKHKYNDAINGVLFCLPLVVLLFGFTIIYPTLYAVRLSFYHGPIGDLFGRFVGLANFRHLATSAIFHVTLRNTVVFTVATVSMGVPVALALALLLNRRYRSTPLFRMLWYAPVVMPIVASIQVWLWMYNPDIGLLNGILYHLDLPPQRWIHSPQTAMASMVFMAYWLVGRYVVVYLAGLQGIPPDLYESSKIDGATKFQDLRYITIPMLKPVTFFVVVIATIEALKFYIPVLLMTRGGPLNTTRLLAFEIWNAAYEFNLWGRSAAMGLVFFVIALALTVIQFKYVPEKY